MFSVYSWYCVFLNMYMFDFYSFLSFWNVVFVIVLFYDVLYLCDDVC